MAVDLEGETRARLKKVFLHKAAKSVSEIQSNVNNLADVLVFLEVLGYNAKEVRDNGFRDMRDLARGVYEVVDYYDSRTTKNAKPLFFRMPTVSRRLLEGLALAAPWLMMLPLVFVFGVSLWMDWRLPAPALTALALGVLLGMLVSEGNVWVFSRLLLFYHSQTNVAETRRVIKRSYAWFSVAVAAGAAAVFSAAVVSRIPFNLAAIAVAAMVTMSVHRFSFTVVYTLRKIRLALVSYLVAVAALLSVYLSTSDLLPDLVTRYLASLGVAFVVLTASAAYCTLKAYSPSPSKVSLDAPTFFKPLFINKKTLLSSFAVQLWENTPYFSYGACFILLMFGDRVLSWFYNPTHLVGGMSLPLVFNTQYHMGADIALFVVFPMGLVQYIMVGHIFEMLHNLSLETPSTQADAIDHFLRRRYLTTLASTLGISGAIAATLFLLAPSIIGLLGGAPVSAGIMRLAALSNVFLAVFVANSSFVMLLNRPKVLALVALLSAGVVVLGGALLGLIGFQDIAYAYLCGCALAAGISSLKVKQLLRRPGSLFLSRF